MHNTYRPKGGTTKSTSRRTQFRIESILVDLQRAQSQKKMPLLTVLFSCACLRGQLSRRLWDMFTLCFPGLLASMTWTEDLFVAFASERRPPCPYEVLPLVGGVVFDNYTRRVQYSSQVTVEKHGYLLNMTNWAHISIPRSLAPANFDATQLCEPSSPQVAAPARSLSSHACPLQGRTRCRPSR